MPDEQDNTRQKIVSHEDEATITRPIGARRYTAGESQPMILAASTKLLRKSSRKPTIIGKQTTAARTKTPVPICSHLFHWTHRGNTHTIAFPALYWRKQRASCGISNC